MVQSRTSARVGALLGLAWVVALLWPVGAPALEPIAVPSGDLRLGHPPPEIEPVDRPFLMTFVRRVLGHQVRGERRYETVYVPPGLQAMRCRAAVTLRRNGNQVAMSESQALPVLEACRSAAVDALADARRDGPVSEADLAELTLEIELIGPRERVGNGNDTSTLMALSFEPAIHGIAVRCDGEELMVRPSQLISRERLCVRGAAPKHECDRYESALNDFREKLGLKADPPKRKPASVVFLRFRTTHLYEPEPGAGPVHLVAGLRVVGPEEVRRTLLTDVVNDLARYLRYRQNTDGAFSYEFLPGRDMYWPETQNWVRQAATTWALGVHARVRRDKASAEAWARAVEVLGKMASPVPGRDRASFIATPDGKNGLGATAMMALALIDAPDPQRFADLRFELMNALAGMQREDGSFKTNFPPAPVRSGQDYYPGEALLAIAKHYVQTRDARWREVCDRSLPFYQAYFSRGAPPSFVPWQAQAWGHLARTTRLQRYADFEYEMIDALLETQLETTDPTLRIYDGGFDAYGGGRAGIASAVYAEGLVDAVRTADVMGDAKRAARYREALKRAVRFVLQLRFRKEEAYYVRSPKDVIGAMRNTPINPTLRIDHSQHGLAALLGALDVLPEKKDAALKRPQG